MADTVPPKHPSQRRRRNKPPVPPKTIMGDLRPGEVPALPGDDWEDWTRECWEIIWTSPMATTYQKVDFAALVRLMQLQNRVATGTIGVAALSEMRQLEDRFGLSPLSRRRLQIDIVDPEPVGQAAGQPDDEGRFLRVVGDA